MLLVGLPMLVGFMFIVGSVGACDNEAISIAQCLIQCLIGFAIMPFGLFIGNLIENWRNAK